MPDRVRAPRGSRADRAWREFDAWCRRHRLRPLPAHPWTVAAFLRWCEHRRTARLIEQDLKSIARIHVLNGHRPPDRHPTVLRTLRIIALRKETKGGEADLFDPAMVRAGETSARTKTETKLAKRSLRMTPRLVTRRDRHA